MKIALVYPYKKEGFQGCNPPVSLLYLAAALRKAGQEVAVFDIDEDNRSEADLIDILCEHSPDVVGIPLFTAYLKNAYNFERLLAKTNHHWKLLIGGPHATVKPIDTLKDFESCDFVIRGEADNSIVELAESLEQRKPLEDVNGLTFRTNGNIVHNADIDVLPDLDTLEFPARDLLASAYKNGTYWRVGNHGVTDIVITSRGCPFSCNFCFKVSNKFRTRSPENIVAELKELKGRGIKNVHIMDDLFVFNKPHLYRVIDLIKKDKLKMKLKVRARTNFIDEEILQKLKEIGVNNIVFGIESGSQKILDQMNKKTTVEMNENAIRMAKKAGMDCYADIFIGYPGETPETIKETENLIIKTKPSAIQVGILYPLPGTKVYNDAIEQGVLQGDWDIRGTHPWVKLPWTESRKDLQILLKRLMSRYVTNPVVIFKMLSTVITSFDIRQYGKMRKKAFRVLMHIVNRRSVHM